MHELPPLNGQLRVAQVQTMGDRLIVSTGRVSRTWRWIDGGFATAQVLDIGSGRSWRGDAAMCDWQLPDASEPVGAQLRELCVCASDDEGFTSTHLAVTALIDYPARGLTLCWQVWAYPDAWGIRTHLGARAMNEQFIAPTDRSQGGPIDGRVELIPIGDGLRRRRFFGYYNATQQRNDTHLHILKEELSTHRLSYRQWCDWASVACVEDDAGGIALVKESHKCVNQGGHVGGGFIVDETTGLACTGWGLRVNEITPDRYTPGWATWTIVWSGGDLARQTAFKAFDKLRYPIDPKRDIYIQANTWGSTDNGHDARFAATEQPVLKELEACAELGIDILQIDDGWQVPPGHATWEPKDNGWHPHPESYPQGWAPVRKRAAELGVKLGLWAAAQPVSLEELKANYTRGGFEQYKLDFAVLKRREEIDELMSKVRDFIAWTGHKVRVNWDVTENPARYGYFFAREYGCIYLENRKPVKPTGVVYRPHTVLRDLWQISKYLNLHRFQCSIQNVDRVDRAHSDAHLHSHSYATAIALMGIPLFFQQTQYYSPQARAEIRRLLDIYKQHRESIYRGMVHPIGQKPDNARWTGFQCHLADEQRGYLMLLRERCNDQAQHTYALAGLDAGPIDLTDLISGQTWREELGPGGALRVSISQAPGFRFMQYKVPGSP